MVQLLAAPLGGREADVWISPMQKPEDMKPHTLDRRTRKQLPAVTQMTGRNHQRVGAEITAYQPDDGRSEVPADDLDESTVE